MLRSGADDGRGNGKAMVGALPFILAVGLSGFLIFQVQPMMGKFLLPVFGGSVTTWSACIAFFQTTLLIGYLYAYLTSRMTVRWQAAFHVGVVLASLALLPITPTASASVATEDNPALGIMQLLAVAVGAPYLILAATSTLVQRWFAAAQPGRDPTRLFAVSNLASFAGLISYPFLFERLAPITTQTVWWSFAYAAYAAAIGWCAMLAAKAAPAAPVRDVPVEGRMAGQDGPTPVLGWVWLSLIGSILLVASTNIITERVAAMPFLWVIPLSLYLLSFVVVFARSDRRRLGGWFAAFLALFLLGLVLQNVEDSYLLILKIAGISGAMFAGCMVVHGELANRRPGTERLPAFYLWMTFGGALGGLFVTFAAPALFSDYWEYEIAIAALVATYVLLRRADLPASIKTARSAVAGAIAAVAVSVVVGLSLFVREEPGDVIEKVRNFYGVVKIVRLDEDDDDERLAMFQSSVNQGEQMADEARRREPACDFGAETGIGLAIRRHPKRIAGQPLRIGIVGLGVGMTLVHGLKGDLFRYYEINPAVTDLARKYFSFHTDTEATFEVVHGDGRLVLEKEGKEGARKFDILIIDAFRGAAPPMHLMTREAFEIYLARTEPDGLIVANFEVERFDPSPLFRGMGKLFNLRAEWFETTLLPDCKQEAVSWAIYARSGAFFEDADVRRRISPWWDKKDTTLVWTDQTSNLFSILNR